MAAPYVFLFFRYDFAGAKQQLLCQISAEKVLRPAIQPVRRRARACNSSKSFAMGGDGLPRQSAPSTTGEKPGRGSVRTFGVIFVLEIDTVKPIPKPLGT